MLTHPGWLMRSAGTNLPQQRNSVVRRSSTPTPNGYGSLTPTTVPVSTSWNDLIDSADAVERPILSALVMAEKTNPYHRIVPACMGFSSLDPPEPVSTRRSHRRNIGRSVRSVPGVWSFTAVSSSGCVTPIRRTHNRGSNTPSSKCRTPKPVNSPRTSWVRTMCLSLRAAALGHPCHVDTEIEAGHIKKRTLTTTDFWPQIPPRPDPRQDLRHHPGKGQSEGHEEPGAPVARPRRLQRHPHP